MSYCVHHLLLLVTLLLELILSLLSRCHSLQFSRRGVDKRILRMARSSQSSGMLRRRKNPALMGRRRCIHGMRRSNGSLLMALFGGVCGRNAFGNMTAVIIIGRASTGHGALLLGNVDRRGDTRPGHIGPAKASKLDNVAGLSGRLTALELSRDWPGVVAGNRNAGLGYRGMLSGLVGSRGLVERGLSSAGTARVYRRAGESARVRSGNVERRLIERLIEGRVMTMDRRLWSSQPRRRRRRRNWSEIVVEIVQVRGGIRRNHVGRHWLFLDFNDMLWDRRSDKSIGAGRRWGSAADGGRAAVKRSTISGTFTKQEDDYAYVWRGLGEEDR